MYSTTIVAGRVGRDAELRATPSGDSVLSFSLAEDRGYGDNKRAVWYAVSVWGDRALKLAEYIVKGKALLVEGQVDARAYTAKDGTPRAALELRARNVTFVGSRQDDGDSGNGSAPGHLDVEFQRQERKAPTEPAGRRVNLNTDDPGIPF